MGEYCRLQNTALLSFGGADAGRFLQGQCTCDILALQQGQASLGAVCTAKGRVIAVFHVLRHDDVYFMAVNKTLAERLCTHLSRYVLRAKVSIADVGADYALFGTIGDIPENPADIRIPFSLYPPALGLSAIALEGSGDLIGQFERLSLQPADEAIWVREVVRHGLPEIDASTSEAFIPQMLNLDLLKGISFTKGCYTGQEIVARTHYLGQSKRRLFRLTAASASAKFTVGERIECPDRQDDGIGTVVSVATADGGAVCQELLAVINLADIHRLPSGLAVEALPYAVDV